MTSIDWHIRLLNRRDNRLVEPSVHNRAGENMKTNLVFLLTVVSLIGCTEQTILAPQPPLNLTLSATVDSISISDDAVLRIVYSTFKVPTNFYHEDLADTNIYYENTVSVLPLFLRTDRWSELSTDDHKQALAWSESSAQYSSYYRTLVAESQTEKYFQFCRVNLQGSGDVLFSRVHKLSYIDRSMYDSFHPTPLIGVFNLRPIDTASVRTLVEYLWFTHEYNNASVQALADPVSESPDSIRCALYLLETVYGDFGLRDYISLTRMLYSVDRLTGKIYLSRFLIRSIQGRLN
jgi:hypothetical protein